MFHTVQILLYSHVRKHNDNTIKTSDTVLRKIYLSLYLKGLCVRGSWRLNRIATYWPPTLLAITAFLSRSPGLLNQGPGGPASLGHVPQSSILSPTRLILNWLIGGLRAPSAGCWLSLQHFVSNWSDPQLVWFPNWLNFLCTELYNSSTPTFFLWASQFRTHSTCPRSRL